MLKLIDIDFIAKELKNASVKNIKILHKIIFETEGDRSNRKHLRGFNGFAFVSNSVLYNEKLNYIQENFSLRELLSVCDILHIEYNDTDINELSELICKSLTDIKSLINENRDDNDEDSSEEDDNEGSDNHTKINDNNSDDSENKNNNGKMRESELKQRNKIIEKQLNKNNEVYKNKTEEKSYNLGMNSKYIFLSPRDVTDMLPYYDPDDVDGLETSKFIKKVSDLKEIYNIEDKLIMLCIATKLRGKAANWFQKEEVYIDFETFARKLTEKFKPKINEADCHIAMFQRKRRRDENLFEYLNEIEKLGRKGKLKDDSIIKYFIIGMNDREMFNVLQTHKISHLDELREKLDWCLNLRKFNNYSFHEDRFTKQSVSFEKKENNIRNHSDKCYNCFEFGHFSQDCPKPEERIRCNVCKKVHKKGEPPECQSNTNKDNLNRFQIALIKVTKPKHKYEKWVEINNDKTIGLIDTGSQCSLITQSEADRLNLKRTSDTIQITGIVGGTVTTNESSEVEMLIDNVKILQKLYIIPDKFLSIPMVIGRNIIDMPNVKLLETQSVCKIELIEKPIQKNLIQEKVDVLERLKIQDIELKDAFSQRKLAIPEYSEVTDKLSELRSQKQKLSRQVRDKEEELEIAMKKIDSLRNDIRKAEKNRRELECRVEDCITEATKERKLRERTEEYCRQLQAEVRTRSTSDLGSSSSLGLSSDTSRLEIDRLEVQNSEKLNQQQSRFNMEIRKKVNEEIDKKKRQWKERYDKHHKPPAQYDEGDLVMVENEPPSTSQSRKLEPRYKGPYMVRKSLGNDRYLLTDIPGAQLRQRKYESVYASDKMKSWCTPFETDDGSDYEDNAAEESRPTPVQNGRIVSDI